MTKELKLCVLSANRPYPMGLCGWVCLAVWAVACHSLGAEVTTENLVGPRHAISAKILRYAQRLVDKYDLNSNGRLESSECGAMRGTPSEADADGDGSVSLTE